VRGIIEQLFRVIDITCDDPDEERRKWLLNMMLVGTVLGAVIIGAVLLIVGFSNTGSSKEEALRLAGGCLVSIVGAVGLYFLNRRVRSEVSGTIFVLFIFALTAISDTPWRVANGRSLVIFSIPILSASVLVRPWATFAAASLSSAIVAVMNLFVLQEAMPNVPAMVAFHLLAIPAWMSSRHLELALHRERESTKRSERLADQLRAIRRVNQIIIRVKDRDRLLAGICEALLQVESHRCVWAVAFDDEGQVVSVGTAGLDEDAASLLKDGVLPPCGREALSGTVSVVTGSVANCIACPLGPDGEAEGALTARLENGGHVYGLLAMHTEIALDADEEIKTLFNEVAGDLGFALATMRLAEHQKQARAELLHQERLAAIGRLGAGIAHDFRNQLATVLLYAQVNASRPDLPPDVVEELNIIIQETRKANDLVRRILDFSSTGAIERQPMDLPDFVGDVLDVLRRTIPENVRISWEREVCDGVLGEHQRAALTVRADARRLQQMLTNLALNARDAMPDGGDLHFSVSRLEVKAGDQPPVEDMEPGSWVELTVSDTGAGMTEEVQDHLFEPFFTTKDEEGTGLGLAQVYGIVRQHEGAIDVESAPDQGTTFRVYFPAYNEPVEDAGPPDAALDSPGGGGQGERILLVEDQDQLREAARTTLASQGYRVLTARDGRKALRLYRDHDVDLVVTDIVMPHIGGKRLLEELTRVDPDVKAVAMTGYAVDDKNALKDIGFLSIVPKPIESARLLRAIRQALAGKS